MEPGHWAALAWCCVPCGVRSDGPSAMVPHRDVFKSSVKALEADVMHANTLLSGEMLRDSEGACLQMRISYSPLAPLLLFLVRWADCSLAGALGLVRVLIFKVYRNGHSTAFVHERRASLRQFSGYLYPALQQLYPGLSEAEFREQRRHCWEHYLSKKDPVKPSSSSLSSASSAAASSSGSMRGWGPSSEWEYGTLRVSGLPCTSSSSGGCGSSSGSGSGSTSLVSPSPSGMQRDEPASGLPSSSLLFGSSAMALATPSMSLPLPPMRLPYPVTEAAMAAERERERECGICLEEGHPKVALPTCAHSMCLHCFQDWHARSQSCPFCRRGLARVRSDDLWEVVDATEVEDLATIARDNLRRFSAYVARLPLAAAAPVTVTDHACAAASICDVAATAAAAAAAAAVGSSQVHPHQSEWRPLV